MSDSCSFSVRPLVLAALLCAGVAQADEAADTARILEAMTRYTEGDVSVEAVHATPASGIYEAVIGNEVIHVDASGRYALIDGRMIDMRERRDLTAARVAKLQAVDFSALPLDLAIKTVRGSGARTLAVFEDPACPVCRQMQATLAQLEDVTIYTFTYPVVAPESIPAAVATQCASPEQRAGRWAAYMEGAPPPQGITPECQAAGTSVSNIVKFGQQHAITNTPTMILADGSRLVGALPLESLDAALSAAPSAALEGAKP